MKKLYYLSLMLILFFTSCNASILMNNGEIEKPGKIEIYEKKESYFSYNGASQISATKSYYKDKIIVRWSSVEGADFYTLEKAVSESKDVDKKLLLWRDISETIEDTCYIDNENMESGKY